MKLSWFICFYLAFISSDVFGFTINEDHDQALPPELRGLLGFVDHLWKMSGGRKIRYTNTLKNCRRRTILGDKIKVRAVVVNKRTKKILTTVSQYRLKIGRKDNKKHNSELFDTDFLTRGKILLNMCVDERRRAEVPMKIAMLTEGRKFFTDSNMNLTDVKFNDSLLFDIELIEIEGVSAKRKLESSNQKGPKRNDVIIKLDKEYIETMENKERKPRKEKSAEERKKSKSKKKKIISKRTLGGFNIQEISVPQDEL